jgi:hypothetical protein
MEVLVEVGIPAVDYPPQELEGELDAAR